MIKRILKSALPYIYSVNWIVLLVLITSSTIYKPKKYTNKVLASTPVETDWHDALKLGISGQAWKNIDHPYDRLPGKMKAALPEPVWKLSHHSAGLHVRFTSTTSSIRVKWKLRFNTNLNHMAPTGVKGLDLYMQDNAVWRWAGVGRPSNLANQELLVSNLKAGEKSFILYLPLYDGVDSVWIGVDKEAAIKSILENRPKIIFYGTSITQGACATRAGMAYPAIIGRQLNYETVNLGFSGNGKLDLPLAELLGETEARMYVLDCLPNLKPEEVIAKTEAFVKQLRQKKADTPILLVENINYDHAWADALVAKTIKSKNENLRQVYLKLKAAGIKELYYLENKTLTGSDGENSVDGVHLTDLGFSRLAAEMAKKIVQIEKKHKN